MSRSSSFLDLLSTGAPREAFDAVVAEAVDSGLAEPELEVLREQLAAGRVLLRAVRHLGALHRSLGRLPARVDLRRSARLIR